MTELRLYPELRRRLIALTACAGPDKRATLATVSFDGEYAWATDSYVLARVPLPANVNKARLVPAKPLARYLRDAPKTAEVTLTLTDLQAQLDVTREDLLTATSQTTRLGYVDGKYPDVRTLLPDDIEDGEAPTFRQDFAAKVAACGPLTSGTASIVRLRFRGEKKPVAVYGTDDELLGLVMPVLGPAVSEREAA